MLSSDKIGWNLFIVGDVFLCENEIRPQAVI